MMQAVAERSPFVADYDAFERGVAGQPESVERLRREGLEVFDRLGFPSKRQEEWICFLAVLAQTVTLLLMNPARH